jgi:RNA polymerase sigma factor (sigma-70 family)
VEVSALKPTALPGPRSSGPLLRLQSDERLIALTRRGQQAAFEALFSRYHARLLAFCRHMLNSKEDAEDVLQEVFAAAFNAILADEREINVRPWLYRIARNRSLNHLRKATAIGVDSMDIHYAEHGISTGEKVLRRESFRQLIGDVQKLPETQRSALLLREIDALSYEQIAQAMETTVPSVKSLLVRARISLAEAAEARQLSCAEVRAQLGEAAEGLLKIEAPARRHLRDCERCRTFRKHLKDNNHALAAIFPVGPLLLLKKLLLSKFGSSAGGAHVAGAGGATATATTVGASAAGAGATGGMGLGGLATAGAGAMATKAAATLAAAALVTAGAVEAGHVGGASHSRRHRASSLSASSAASAAAGSAALNQLVAPAVVHSAPQPVSSGAVGAIAAAGAHHLRRHRLARRNPPATSDTTAAAKPAPVTTAVAAKPTGDTTETTTTDTTVPAAKPPVTQVTTETTQLPSSASTTATQPAPATTPPGTGTAAETPLPPPPSPPATTTGGTEAGGAEPPTSATTPSAPTPTPGEGAPQSSTTSTETTPTGTPPPVAIR